MTFTDDDLKKLKKEFADWNFPRVDNNVMEALLARLEAAEKVCKFISDKSYLELPDNAKRLATLELAWRKAAGK